MLNLSMAQALSLWTDLMEAEFGCHGFGGDTVEIYAYRLQPCRPTAETPCGKIGEEAVREQGLLASQNLYEILTHFRDERQVDVFVHCGRTDDGEMVGEWMLSQVFQHRTQCQAEEVMSLKEIYWDGRSIETCDADTFEIVKMRLADGEPLAPIKAELERIGTGGTMTALMLISAANVEVRRDRRRV